MALMQSQLFALGAVGELFDVDHTTLAPVRSSKHLNFDGFECTV